MNLLTTRAPLASVARAALIVITLGVASCGGGDGATQAGMQAPIVPPIDAVVPPVVVPPGPTYSIGGTVVGLQAGSSLVLRNNGADPTTVSANGAFSFNTALSTGSRFDVKVATPPSIQPCTQVYSQGSVVASNVTSVRVFCGPPLAGVFTVAPNMVSARYNHGMALLNDGRVFIAGGFNAGTPTNVVEIFDPSNLTNTQVANMPVARYAPEFTTLAGGKVLLGTSDGGAYEPYLYDPSANTWTTLTTPFNGVLQANVTALRDGRALMAGGYSPSGEINAWLFNPVGNTWTATGGAFVTRSNAMSVMLSDGRVLVTGGSSSGTPSQIYDAVANTWTAAASMITERIDGRMVLLPDGRVLAAGGIDASYNNITDAEIYDPSTNAWSSAGMMISGRYLGNLILLPTGKVLYFGAGSNAAELYDPVANTWNATATYAVGDSVSALRLNDGRVYSTGGVNPPFAQNLAFFYN